MKVLVLNASPKHKGSASSLYSSILRLPLRGCEVHTCPLRGTVDFAKALSLLSWAETVVISAPLYVDAAPAHMIAFLEQAEQYCKENPCSFRLYVISNSGFIEGRQNELHLRIYEAWCRRTGMIWCGGLGIGGGVILRWMCMLTGLFAVLDTGRFIFQAQTNELTALAVLRCYSSMLVTAAMCLPALICLWRMGCRIQCGCSCKNQYTRCLIPAFLFIPISDMFMAISALTYGQLPHRLLKRSKADFNNEKECPL